MQKRLYIFAVLFVLYFAVSSYAAVNSEKYTGPLLTACSMYQLGGSDFVVRFSGRKLPMPSTETDNDALVFMFDGARAKNPNSIKSSMEDYIEGVPILYSFTLENLSDDKISIRLEADAPLKILSGSRSAGSISFRIQAEERTAALDDFAALPPKPAAPAPETALPFTATTRTTIEFREAELQDVFRLFMAALGRNVVLDASFPRDVRVTMTLVDVRIDEIMNYLLRTYDIACYNYGPNITAFGTKQGLYRLSGAREVKSFRIAYAEPAQISTMLKTLTGLTDQEVVIDERMKTLYLNTNPAKMEEAEDLISRMDTPAKQVMIRASIFEFDDSATKAVQTAINMVYDRWSLYSDPGSYLGQMEWIDQTYSQGRSALDRYITATLNALENKDKGRTIANPSVIAIDGQEASINLKQDIMYRSGLDEKGNLQWDTTEVGPELKFKPRIEDNGYINLELSINTGDYLGSDSDENIRTTKRDMKTRIRVRDGMPFVVGGLFQEINTSVKTKIPILGDIPLFGALFRSTANDKEKSQAVMIVTPYILDTK